MRIGILLGDDIGLEVVPECVKVMKAAAARERLEIGWQPFPIGKRGHEEHGNTLPTVTEQGLRELDGWVMGPIGHAAYPRGDATWVMPPVRKKFDLFAAVRPALSHATIPSIHRDVDIVFLRELTEGMLYSETVVAGAPEFRPNDDITVAMRVITRKGSNRVAREAFEIARTRKRKKVTAAHKEPGDILTDIGAGLVGGLGLAPGLCVGERQAMAQATHGSAPDITGRNIANPYAMIVSGQMLLAWLGRKRGEPKATAAAGRIHAAVNTVIAAGKHLTRDLGGQAGTTEMGDAIAAAVQG